MTCADGLRSLQEPPADDEDDGEWGWGHEWPDWREGEEEEFINEQVEETVCMLFSMLFFNLLQDMKHTETRGLAYFLRQEEEVPCEIDVEDDEVEVTAVTVACLRIKLCYITPT